MDLEQRYVAVSVESRKGGVGKTTTALNLARMALKRYHVLYLDLDVAGTEASSIADETLWKNYIHRVSRIGEARNETDLRGVNLVNLFDVYMEGEALGGQAGASQDKSGGDLRFEPGKINVLSSFLARNRTGESSVGDEREPGVMFDDMHCEWFLEMLREVVREAARAFEQVDVSRKQKKELLVVIDNAPGYSGYEPLVEDWLTDLGPERGKFVYVSSLDTQDITACAKGLGELYELFESKWRASRDYVQLGQAMEELPADERVEERVAQEKNRAERIFFQRLAETAPTTDDGCQGVTRKDKRPDQCTECGLCFYRQRDVASRRSKGTRHPWPAQRFLGILINRVPRLLVPDEERPDGERPAYKIGPLLRAIGLDSCDDNATLQDIRVYARQQGESIPVAVLFSNLERQLIPYDENIEIQFLRRHILQRESRGELIGRDKTSSRDPVVRELTELRRVASVASWPEANVGARSYLREALVAMGEIDARLGTCRQICRDGKRQWVEAFWDNRFSIVEALRTPPPQFMPAQRQRESRRSGSLKERLDEVRDLAIKVLVRRPFLRAQPSKVHSESRMELRLAYDLALMNGIALMNADMRSINSQKIRERVREFSETLIELLARWKSKRRSKKFTSHYFAELADAIVKQAEIDLLRLPDSAATFDVAGMAESLRYFCLAEARMLAWRQDLGFQIDCLIALARLEQPTWRTVPVIRQLAQNVVIERQMTHKRGRAYLADMMRVGSVQRERGKQPLKSSSYDEIRVMGAYEKAIREIAVEQWQLTLSI